MERLPPLNDDFTRNCPFWKSKFDHYLDSINKQLASRPEVWGVGLWQEAETERVAKGIAELWVSYGEVKSTSFIPADKLRIIELADYEWGLVSSNLDDIEREFNCKIDVEELISNEEMTFGDLARIVREREGSHQPEPMPVQMPVTNIEGTMADAQRRNWAWRRWTARGIDEFVGTLAVFVVVMSIGASVPDSPEPSVVEGVMALVALALILLTLPLSIFASSVQYALFGGTFGKWICGVRVSDEQGNKPTRWGFFWRDIKVLVRGEWLRLWVLALIGNVIQYNRIVAGKPASYEASSPFQARPTREGRWYDILLVLLVFVLGIVQFVLIQIMYA